MKYAKGLAVRTLLALALISFALFIHNASAQQEPKQTKFKPAPAGAKGVKEGIYEVSFDQKLSEEDFEKELERIKIQYGAELADPALFGPPHDEIKTKIFALRLAVLRVPEARAKQIAEEDVVIEVAQVHDVEVKHSPLQPKSLSSPNPRAPRKLRGRGKPEQSMIFEAARVGK